MSYKDEQQATRNRLKQFTVITPAKDGANRVTRRKKTKPQYSPQEQKRRGAFMALFQRTMHALKSSHNPQLAYELLTDWVFARKMKINGVKE